MRSRFAVLLAVGAAFAGGCRRTENAAPSPSPTAAAIATPTPSPLPPLRDPSRAAEQAPDKFRVRFETTKGPFVVEVTRAWAPHGADRFFNLVRVGYYDDVAFFRVIENFMVQFGINGDPTVNSVWREARIPDDPVRESNRRGTLTFATAGPDTRTTQLFINFRDNTGLDGQGFAPFGRVVEGMSVVDSLYSGYGEGAPRGMGPDQGRAQAEGNAYIRGSFPKLDLVKTARIVTP
jgi:peptidyl-prolyl cis-trans isomerase A (cyclophilin A)